MTKVHVQQALDIFAVSTDAYIQTKMKPLLGGTLEWTSILQELDKMRGKGSWTYSARDPALQLRMLTERLGGLGYPFDEGDPNRTLSSYGSVLRIVRNRLSHGGEFETFDALHAVDTVRTVLAHIGDVDASAKVADIRTTLLGELVDAEQSLKVPTEQVTPVPRNSEEKEPGNVRADYEDGLFGQVPWEPWTTVVVGEQEDLDSMRTNRVKESVRGLIEIIGESEGPVHQDRVAKLVGLAFGFSRLAPQRAKRILGQISKASVYVDGDGFVWPLGINRDEWLIFRTSTESQRPFHEISPVEIANAAVSLLKADEHRTEVELARGVLQLFGRTRGSKVATRQVQRGMDYARAMGRIPQP